MIAGSVVNAGVQSISSSNVPNPIHQVNTSSHTPVLPNPIRQINPSHTPEVPNISSHGEEQEPSIQPQVFELYTSELNKSIQLHFTNCNNITITLSNGKKN